MKTTIIDQTLLKEVSNEAALSERKRMNRNFHKLEDAAQRFLNAIEPESYIRPHQHVEPVKDEAFIILQGRGAALFFDDHGTVTDCILLDQKAGNIGIDIPGGVLHTILSLQTGTVFYEVKPGPYTPASDKCFPDWAPLENSPDVKSYYQKLKNTVMEFYPDAFTVS